MANHLKKPTFDILEINGKRGICEVRRKTFVRPNGTFEVFYNAYIFGGGIRRVRFVNLIGCKENKAIWSARLWKLDGEGHVNSRELTSEGRILMLLNPEEYKS